MQNGLHEAVLAEHLGVERTVGAFVDFFADVVEPGVIAGGGTGALVLGELDGRTSTRIAELARDLATWGPVETTTT
ncbi:MAG: hypothetical protein GEV07_04355 [Streptosporangiales bacterium]|nr:hypothetical protein [Streptosporangiales bacterium]